MCFVGLGGGAWTCALLVERGGWGIGSLPTLPGATVGCALVEELDEEEELLGRAAHRELELRRAGDRREGAKVSSLVARMRKGWWEESAEEPRRRGLLLLWWGDARTLAAEARRTVKLINEETIATNDGGGIEGVVKGARVRRTSACEVLEESGFEGASEAKSLWKKRPEFETRWSQTKEASNSIDSIP